MMNDYECDEKEWYFKLYSVLSAIMSVKKAFEIDQFYDLK